MELIDVVNGHNFWLGIPIILVLIGLSLCVLMIGWIVKCKPRNKEEKDFVARGLIISIVIIASAFILFKNYETFPVYCVKIDDSVSYNAITDVYEVLGEDDGIWKLRSYTDNYFESIIRTDLQDMVEVK